MHDKSHRISKNLVGAKTCFTNFDFVKKNYRVTSEMALIQTIIIIN